MKVYKKYIGYFFKSYTKYCMESIILVFILALIQGFIPVSIKLLLNKLPGETDIYRTLTLCIVGYAAVYLVYNFISVAWYMSLDVLGGKIMQHLREKIMVSIKTASYEDLLILGRDKIKNILYMDTLNVFSSITLQSVQAFANFIILILFICIAAFSNIWLGIVLASGAVIGYGISYLSRKIIIQSSREVNMAMKNDNQILNQYIDSMELEKQNNLGDYFISKSNTALWNFISTALRVDKKQIFLKNLIDHFHQLFSIGITLYLMLVLGNNSASEVVFFMLVADVVIQKSTSLENAFYSINKTLPSFENIENIISMGQESSGVEVGKIENIEFKNVSFTYKNSESVIISNMNASFRSGDVVKVVGINGSGKSTLFKLLSGLLDAKGGEILYNGINIRDISRDELRKRILYIDQNEVILNESVVNYLRIITGGKYSHVKHASFIRDLELDIDVDQIKDNGNMLSNGQRKKLLMAKLLCCCEEASIILIDELDAGLDIRTNELLKNIEQEIIKKNSQCIIFKISHQQTDNMDLYTRVLEL